MPRDYSHCPRSQIHLFSIDAHGSAVAIRRNDRVKHLQNVPSVGSGDGRLPLLPDAMSELLEFRHRHHLDVVAFDLRTEPGGLSERGVHPARHFDIELQETPAAQSDTPGSSMDVDYEENVDVAWLTRSCAAAPREKLTWNGEMSSTFVSGRRKIVWRSR